MSFYHAFRYGPPKAWSLAEKIVIGLAGIGWLYVFLYDSPTVALFYSGLFVFSVVLRAIVGMNMWINFEKPAEVTAWGFLALVILLITNSLIYTMTQAFSLPLSSGTQTVTIVSLFEAEVITPLLRSIFIAVAEEETFRGTVLDLVESTPRRWDEYASLFLISGFGFSLAHAKAWYGATHIADVFTLMWSNPAPFVVGVLGGIALGFTALKTRNLAPCIIAHALYDFLAFVRV